jgi:hypothetical protein
MIENLEYYFNFFVNGQNYTPLLSGKKSFSLGESIFSLYPTAMLELYLPSYLIEEGLISIGATAEFEIYASAESFKIKKEYKIWKIEVKASEDNRTLSGIYIITFIHPWFFNQEAKSKAYGGTVQLVLYNLLKDELYRNFPYIDVDDSIDITSKYFRTYQNVGEFIETRLSNSYIVDNSPTFIYANSHNEFHAHSFLNMLNLPKKNKLIDLRSIKIEEPLLAETKKLNRLVMPVSISYSLNPSGNIWNKMNIKTKFLSTDSVSQSLKSMSGDNSAFGSSGFIPIDSSLLEVKYPLAVYLDDSERNQLSIYASFFDKQKDFLLDQTFSITCFPNFSIKIGESIDFYLKKEEKKDTITADINSIFYATYVITSIRHIQINNSFITQLTLCRDVIDSKSKDALKAVKGVIS